MSAVDNYVDAVSNRSEYPLKGGFVTLNSEHPSWSRTFSTNRTESLPPVDSVL